MDADRRRSFCGFEPELPAIHAESPGRLEEGLLKELHRNNAAQLDEQLSEFACDWSALEDARRNRRRSRWATAALWVVFLALVSLIGAAAILLGGS